MGCAAQGFWSPQPEQRGMSPSALVPPSLSPQALAPGGGQWGSPRWQQGREDRIWAGGCSRPW